MEEIEEFIQSYKCMGNTFMYSEDLLYQIEKFTCRFYNIDDISKANKARLNSLKRGNYEQMMPCNLDSLQKHLNRSVYQVAILRGELTPIINAPDPSNHG